MVAIGGEFVVDRLPEITLKVRVSKRVRFRIWLGVLLLKLAAWVLQGHAEVVE